MTPDAVMTAQVVKEEPPPSQPYSEEYEQVPLEPPDPFFTDTLSARFSSSQSDGERPDMPRFSGPPSELRTPSSRPRPAAAPALPMAAPAPEGAPHVSLLCVLLFGCYLFVD